MSSVLQAQLTFHLRGAHASSSLAALESPSVRPALLSRYENLSELRYDFPLVLFDNGDVEALSGVVDRLLLDLADGDDATRVSQYVIRLERRIRELVAVESGTSFFELWRIAALELQAADSDDAFHDSLRRARHLLKIDGIVADCDRALPGRLMAHVWRALQSAKAERFRREIGTLIQKLSDILRAEVAVSSAGQTPDWLRASLGPQEEHAFDFQAMSNILRQAAPEATLSDRRRERITATLSALQAQRFFTEDEGYAFAFTSCAAALNAYWARRAEMMDLVRAIDVARLEVDGMYQDAAHDVLVGSVERVGLDPSSASMFPDYLVELDVDDLPPVEQAAVLEVLSAGLPMKVLLQTNDVLDAPSLGPAHFGFGFTSRQLVNTAIGLNDAYVLQAPSSHLLKRLDAIRRGLGYHGAALFSVFSGVTGYNAGLPAYLTAAAAMESRAFPTFVYDPSAGTDWASRFSLAGNPQADADWPVHGVNYETADHQSASKDVAFTFVDFVACDERYSRYFANVDRQAWHDWLIPVADALNGHPPEWDRVPSVLVVDRAHRLAKLIVDDVLVRQARRCRDLWHSLQELGGIHNSHALRERQRSAAREQPVVLKTVSDEDGKAERARASEPRERSGDSGAPASERERGSAGAEPPGSKDDPYIETPRCSTCNECVQLNNRMFGYNANRQAFIADPAAGTYRQLVEAAESCQVSIIHPGKPRNSNEPGLEELLKRAEAFL